MLDLNRILSLNTVTERKPFQLFMLSQFLWKASFLCVNLAKCQHRQIFLSFQRHRYKNINRSVGHSLTHSLTIGHSLHRLHSDVTHWPGQGRRQDWAVIGRSAWPHKESFTLLCLSSSFLTHLPHQSHHAIEDSYNFIYEHKGLSRQCNQKDNKITFIGWLVPLIACI